MDATKYASKLARMESATLLSVLDSQAADFIRRLAESYRFTFQELKQVSQAARDLQMWSEAPLQHWWEQTDTVSGGDLRSRKKSLLLQLAEHMSAVGASEKVYPESGLGATPRRQVRLQETQTSRKIMGLCPAYSEETVCCGLHTLDAVRGCPFSCSYCTIQTFYGETAELEEGLAAKLAEIELDPQCRYHIGTGQASDSLVWGNRGGILEALLEFATDNPNVLLELKTKSDNVSYLVQQEIPENVVCSWTLNTDNVICSEEKGAAGLDNRLRAARRLADRGVPVGFHFHPMIFYRDWEDDYRRLVGEVLERFTPDEVSFISMGSVTLIKPVLQEIRRRGGETKILQMERVQDHHGKLTYPDELKLRLFGTLYDAFKPWHQRVFFYLCMETASIWRGVFGHAYSTNSEFESDFLDRCLPSTVRPVLRAAT